MFTKWYAPAENRREGHRKTQKRPSRNMSSTIVTTCHRHQDRGCSLEQAGIDGNPCPPSPCQSQLFPIENSKLARDGQTILPWLGQSLTAGPAGVEPMVTHLFYCPRSPKPLETAMVLIVMYGQIRRICGSNYTRCFFLKKNKNNNKITSHSIL